MSASLGAITTGGFDGGRTLTALATAGYFGTGGSILPWQRIAIDRSVTTDKEPPEPDVSVTIDTAA